MNICHNGHDKNQVGLTKSRNCCRQCARDAKNAWVARNPEKCRLAALRYRYGLDKDITKGTSCAICDSLVNLVVDHNHKTNQVRASLCQKCNKAVGFLQDSPVLCRNAADYLEKYGCYSS